MKSNRRISVLLITILCFLSFFPEMIWAQQTTTNSSVQESSEAAKETPKDTTKVIENVIHTGFGLETSKNENTEAVGTYDNTSELSKSMAINPANTLYGRIPGLTVLGNGGLPPTSPNLSIRGKSTFNSSNSPLVLIDGFDWSLSSLAPDEIQNVTVLKGAAALAKYGQRGANGVILVNTKRGTDYDGLHVSASYQQGITKPIRLPSFVGASKYVDAVNEARNNDGRSPRYLPPEVKDFNSEDSSPYLFPDVNWFDKTLRDHGVRSKFNANFRGGGDRAHYYAFINLINDNGLFEPTNKHSGYSTQAKYSRFRFRSNLDVDVTKNLLLTVNVAGGIVEQNIPGSGNHPSQIMNALYKTPSAAFPVTTPDGSIGGTKLYNGNNPVAMASENGYGKPNSREFSITGKLRQNLDSWLDGLSAEADVSFRNYGLTNEHETKNYSYKSLNAVRDVSGNVVGTSESEFGEDTDLSYGDSFNRQRQFSDILGKVMYDKAVGYKDELNATISYHQASLVLRGQNNTRKYQNLFGNIHYNMNGKYFLGATLSYSGNNYLPSGNRFNVFPAVSAGWLLSKEEFMSDVSFINRLKLRASWGINGDDHLPSSEYYRSSYSGAGGYPFRENNETQGGYSQGRLATPNPSVEKSRKINVGVDASILSTIDFSVDFFHDRRTDILTYSGGTVSNVLGFLPPRLADGIVENKGVEASLKWTNSIGDWNYHLGGQFSFARNKIINRNEQYRPYPYLRRTGESVNQPFGLEALGMFKDENDIKNSPEQLFSDVKPGDIKYKDQNNDGIIDEEDAVALGHPSGYPEIYFSVSMGFKYKGFGVSALFQGTENYSTFLSTNSVYRPIINNRTISNYYYNNRWTKETAATAKYPRLTTQSNDNNFRPNSLWLANKSYIKLRNARVYYSLPAHVTEKLKMDNILVFIKGRNLFSIDDIPVLNPEQLTSSYPVLRSYSAGLKIAF